MFDGTFEDLINTMEDAGFQVVFHPPGLKNSSGTLIIEKTPAHSALDQKTCGFCNDPCGTPWCVTKREKPTDILTTEEKLDILNKKGEKNEG